MRNFPRLLGVLFSEMAISDRQNRGMPQPQTLRRDRAENESISGLLVARRLRGVSDARLGQLLRPLQRDSSLAGWAGALSEWTAALERTDSRPSSGLEEDLRQFVTRPLTGPKAKALCELIGVSPPVSFRELTLRLSTPRSTSTGEGGLPAAICQALDEVLLGFPPFTQLVIRAD